MDEYIKEENIIKNETYEALKELLFCPICFNLILTPMECSKCQNCICKNCFDIWINKGKKCPNGCESEFHKVIEKKNHIFKINDLPSSKVLAKLIKTLLINFPEYSKEYFIDYLMNPIQKNYELNNNEKELLNQKK